MPTRHKRHSVTETPEVSEALAPLRQRSERVVLGELIVLGAREKLRQLERDDPAATAARGRLAERVRTRSTGADSRHADEVRRGGWARA